MDDDMQFDEFLEGIDTIFYGRVSYDQWGNYHPAPDAGDAEKSLWERVHSKKKFVFSRESREDANATFVNSDIAIKVDQLLKEPGKDIWLYGGASLISTFISLGLVDQYRLSVHPTVLGSGKPLFQNLKAPLQLHLRSTKTYRSGVVQLIYDRTTAK